MLLNIFLLQDFTFNLKQNKQMQIQFSERELEDFLCEDGNLQKYLGLRFVARQVSIPPIGIIDILAFDWDSKSWVIIELKKDLLDANALCQGLSYLNYYKYLSNYKASKRKFKLLLIGQNLDFSLHKNTHFFDNCFFDEWDIYYTLFGLNFTSGVDFTYRSEQQQAIKLQLGNYHDTLSLRNNQTKIITQKTILKELFKIIEEHSIEIDDYNLNAKAELLLEDCEDSNICLQKFLSNCEKIKLIELNGKLPPNFYFIDRG